VSMSAMFPYPVLSSTTGHIAAALINNYFLSPLVKKIYIRNVVLSGKSIDIIFVISKLILKHYINLLKTKVKRYYV
jgi:hypothetical protein